MDHKNFLNSGNMDSSKEKLFITLTNKSPPNCLSMKALIPANINIQLTRTTH